MYRFNLLRDDPEGDSVLPSGAVLFLVLLLTCLGGCAPTVSPRPREGSSHPPAVTGQSLPSPQTISEVTGATTESYRRADLERSALLWQSRTREDEALDFPIGPGDVLEITVPNMEELRTRTVQVSAAGTISLPFVGEIRASGQTQERLREEIRRRLEENYMYNPQVNLFAREYRSRQVAVIGAVAKPGLYSLASGADTLLDMISLAGGMKEEAATRILFIPAEPGANEKTRELASTLPLQQIRANSSTLTLKGADPIEIDLKSLTKGGSQISLSLPARPGDVIIVPGGGEVLVEGWVEKPAAYKITPGLTVLGAVAAAGGPHFAADTNSVKIIRLGKEGGQILFVVDLEKIKRGESPDIPVQEGDIVEVSSSTPKLASYGMFRFFVSVFHVGTYMGF
jgi:polysaccharide biosynthesis/export protein